MTAITEDPPTSPLMTYLLAILSTLMAPVLPDLALARLAAQEAIAAHQARGPHEQMTIAQILAFAVTALDTLRLSMPADLSLSMKLKLRGNANGLDRAARDNTSILEQARRTAQTPEPNYAEHAATAGWEAAEPEPPTTQPKGPIDLAGAMKTVAARLQAGATTASAAQQKVNAMWADTLTNVATEIAQGKHQPTQGRGKADLLRTTLMPTSQPFPTHALK
jgi:hypothetical protein